MIDIVASEKVTQNSIVEFHCFYKNIFIIAKNAYGSSIKNHDIEYVYFSR